MLIFKTFKIVILKKIIVHLRYILINFFLRYKNTSYNTTILYNIIYGYISCNKIRDLQ